MSSSPTSNLVRAAGLIIYRRKGSNLSPVEYLLLQTSYGQHHWTPPKGHVDPGEDEFETALRETREEAGYSRQDLEIFEGFKKELNYDVVKRGVSLPKRVTYWLARLVDPEKPVKLSDEHRDLRWLPLKQACELSGYKDMNEVLTECEEAIRNKRGGD